MKNYKVAVIGAGSVGATVAYTLAIKGAVAEIALIDLDVNKAEAEAADIVQGLPLGKPVTVYAAGYDACRDAEIVIITAGAKQRPGETRVELLDRNVGIVRGITTSILNSGFDGSFLMVTNPVDVLTYQVWKESGFPYQRVIGSGTVLDSARLKNFLARQVSVSPQHIHGYVLGEHGDTSFPAWSLISIGGVPFDEYCRGCSDTFDKELIKAEAEEYVRRAAGRIIEAKGSTFYAIAQAVSTIVESMLRDERRIVPISSIHHNRADLPDTALSFPSVVGKGGLVELLPFVLPEAEMKRFRESAEFIASVIRSIGY